MYIKDPAWIEILAGAIIGILLWVLIYNIGRVFYLAVKIAVING